MLSVAGVVDPREIALVVGIGGHTATYTTGADGQRPIGWCEAAMNIDDDFRRCPASDRDPDRAGDRPAGPALAPQGSLWATSSQVQKQGQALPAASFF
jgi:hypothetical protein